MKEKETDRKMQRWEGDGSFFGNVLRFSVAKTKRLELTGNSSRFPLFLSHGRSLPLVTQTPTAAFHQTLFPHSHSTKTLSVWRKHFHVNFSGFCVCVCPCVGPPGPLLKKKKKSLSPQPYCFLQESLQSFTPHSSPSPLSIIHTLLCWHHAEYKMFIQHSREPNYTFYSREAQPASNLKWMFVVRMVN